jgi:hypothetical protein
MASGRHGAIKGSYDPNDAFLFNVNIHWSKLPWSDWSTF